jgi:hypothetical protein
MSWNISCADPVLLRPPYTALRVVKTILLQLPLGEGTELSYPIIRLQSSFTSHGNKRTGIRSRYRVLAALCMAASCCVHCI